MQMYAYICSKINILLGQLIKRAYYVETHETVIFVGQKLLPTSLGGYIIGLYIKKTWILLLQNKAYHVFLALISRYYNISKIHIVLYTKSNNMLIIIFWKGIF